MRWLRAVPARGAVHPAWVKEDPAFRLKKDPGPAVSMVTGAGPARQVLGHFWLVECEHLLSEEISEQDDGIAVRALRHAGRASKPTNERRRLCPVGIVVVAWAVTKESRS